MSAMEDTVLLDDLDSFAAAVMGWHQRKVAVLQHMTEVPEGTEVSINGDATTAIALTGDVLAGFKLGIELSLMELGELPFFTETTDPMVTDAP